MTHESSRFDINLQVVWDCECYDEWYVTFNTPNFELCVCTKCLMHVALPGASLINKTPHLNASPANACQRTLRQRQLAKLMAGEK